LSVNGVEARFLESMKKKKKIEQNKKITINQKGVKIRKFAQTASTTLLNIRQRNTAECRTTPPRLKVLCLRMLDPWLLQWKEEGRGAVVVSEADQVT
jgi:hypothetical protein